VGRFTADKKKKPGAILKDLDIKESQRKLYMPHDLKKEFVKQLKLDCEFLAHNNVMDYSLLIGIYYETSENKEKTSQNIKKLAESKTNITNLYKNKFQQHFNGIKFQGEDGTTEIYYVGIIDVLIQYQTKKKIEGFLKSVAYAGEEVSVSQPSYYASRFYAFMRNIVGKPPSEPESSSSSSEETKFLDDLPEPGTGEIIRPENSDKERRNTAMSTSGSLVSVPQAGNTSKRATRQTDARMSKVLDKQSTVGTQ